MKKIIALLFTLVSTVSYAQVWYVGLKAGPTFSNYKTKTPWKEVANTGFSFGATAYRQLKTNFGIGVDLQYIQKGYYHKVCNTIYDKLEATYLEVPIMADYSFIIPSLENWKGHATLGVYTAYWLSGKYETAGYDAGEETFDFKKSNASRFDFGPNLGGRIEYMLNNGSLSLDFRYEIGLLDLQKKLNDDTSNTNRAFIIGVSYMKMLGK